MRVLLIEDEHYLAEAIQHLLKRSGYTVDIASDGEMGLHLARSDVYGAIILDNMLPKLSGVKVLRALRKEKNSVPILMLSAKSEVDDKVEGLEVGADDYLAKPFKTGELIARLRAIVRRHTHDQTGNEAVIGDLVLSPETRSLHCDNKNINLTAKEYDLLDMLGSRVGKIISTEALFHRAWGADIFVEPRHVSVYMSHLRRKLTSIGSTSKIIAVRGIGYKLMTGGESV